MTQLALAFARRSDPPTSHDAAARVDATRLEARVLEALAKYPMTSRECADYLGLDLVTISPRFAPLERKGRIYRTTIKRGRSQVWALR